MAYLIVAVMVGALSLGYPPVPVMVAGTIAIIALSYAVSRHPALLRLGMSFIGFILAHVLLAQLDSDVLAAASNVEKAVLEFGASDNVMVAVSSLVMLIAVMVGMFGTRKEDSLAEFIKKHEGKQR